MKLYHLAAAASVMISLGVSATASAADNEGPTVVGKVVWTHTAVDTAARPAILPALYVTLGAVQAWDAYTTMTALNAGAREANPAAARFAESRGSMLALKAATTASTVFFAERLWRKNRTAAVVMMVAINGTTAAIAMHNTRNTRLAGR